MKITKSNIARLTCPQDKDEVAFADDEVSGLVLRAYQSGRQAWYLRFRDAHGRSRRLLLGDARAIDPAGARDLARKAVREVADGNNPVAARKAARTAINCRDLFEQYLKHAATTRRATTLDGATRNLMKYAAPMHSEPISAITRGMVRALQGKLVETVGPVQTNRVLATLSACWSWALRNGVIAEGDNPASYIDRFPEQPRERVLTMGELRLIWRVTAGGNPYSRLVRLLMLTATRRSEAGGMAWSELNGDLWVVPASRMKNGDAHEVALPGLALDQLPSRGNHPFVFGKESPFSGWSGAKERLDKGIAKLRAEEAKAVIETDEQLKNYFIPRWGLHDLRRTFSTEMNARRLADPHIVEAALAHVGAKGGVAGVYNLAAYRPEKKAALEAWVRLLADEDVCDAAR